MRTRWRTPPVEARIIGMTGHHTRKVLVALLAILATLQAATALATAHTVARGVGIPSLAQHPQTERDKTIAELAGPLNADVVRLDLFWSSGEPTQGIYDDSGYLQQVVDTVTAAHAQGLKVVLSVYKTPRWASDTTFWKSPPQGYTADTYQPFYPMKASAVAEFGAFAQHVATLLQGKVYAYECWNEPNLYPFFYPQQTGGDGAFAVTTYAKYLAAFSAGVRAGDAEALVIAGATAPGGGNDRYRTSPQRFAAVLKQQDVDSLFDMYSHHPYTTGGSAQIAPGDPPSNPSVLVNLGNIKTLLDVWPTKSFVLTEYGYNTEYTYAFNFSVSEAVQAKYLRKAYALAARYPQITALLWWETRDRAPGGYTYDPRGIYTGLRDLSGHRKRAWFAFAGGNVLTLRAPARAGIGDSVRLQGTYTCSTIGGVAGRALFLQRRWGDGAWKTVRTVTTGDNGYYKTFVTLKRTTRYRMVFAGVVASTPAVVRPT
jgi:hypothetical protein